MCMCVVLFKYLLNLITVNNMHRDVFFSGKKLKCLKALILIKNIYIWNKECIHTGDKTKQNYILIVYNLKIHLNHSFLTERSTLNVLQFPEQES